MEGRRIPRGDPIEHRGHRYVPVDYGIWREATVLLEAEEEEQRRNRPMGRNVDYSDQRRKPKVGKGEER